MEALAWLTMAFAFPFLGGNHELTQTLRKVLQEHLPVFENLPFNETAGTILNRCATHPPKVAACGPACRSRPRATTVVPAGYRRIPKNMQRSSEIRRSIIDNWLRHSGHSRNGFLSNQSDEYMKIGRCFLRSNCCPKNVIELCLFTGGAF